MRNKQKPVPLQNIPDPRIKDPDISVASRAEKMKQQLARPTIKGLGSWRDGKDMRDESTVRSGQHAGKKASKKKSHTHTHTNIHTWDRQIDRRCSICHLICASLFTIFNAFRTPCCCTTRAKNEFLFSKKEGLKLKISLHQYFGVSKEGN